MQLPPALRQAIDRELEGVSLADLTQAADTLSRRYRAEIRDGRHHLDDAMAARAYLATRLPATFGAIAASLWAVVESRPDFKPRNLLDIGAGPGTATWAASAIWDSVTQASLVEASPAIREIGGRLSGALALDKIAWHAESVAGGLRERDKADLVLMAYVLDELQPSERTPLIARLWELTAGALVIVEPGTSAGWQRILAARAQLVAAGAHILAPCPHDKPCPLSAPDWCHFAARVARSRLHREAKGGSVPWEDEKFIYLAVGRAPLAERRPRIIAPPYTGKAAIRLKLCQGDGTSKEQTYRKRDQMIIKALRRSNWGDTVPPYDQ